MEALKFLVKSSIGYFPQEFPSVSGAVISSPALEISLTKLSEKIL